MIVVTGGAGFIGSNLLAALEERGAAPLVCCDLLHNGDKWRNVARRELADLIPPDRLLPFLDAHAGRITAIFHMGAVSATTETDADLIVAANFTLSSALLEWCAGRRVPLIYASSAATYGDGAAGFDDDGSPAGLARLRPLNPYGWSKHLFDRKVARLAAEGGRDTLPPHWAGLKFFNVYGPNEYHKGGQMSLVPQIYPRAVAGLPARLFRSHHPAYPDGGQMRDFVWVDDVVAAMLWLLDHPEASGLYNLGSGRARSFADLASAVYRALGQEPAIEYVDTPAALRDKYQYFTEARMERLRRAGFTRPATPLEDGVARYVTGFLARPDPYR